jgi:putative two-component system response regulator
MLTTSARVLLVDEDETSLELLGAVLSGNGFVVTLARDARAAQEELRRTPFDAVVADPRIDGRDETLTLLQASKHCQAGVAVILASRQPDVEGVVAALRLGAFDYLRKPVNPLGLVQRVGEGVLERSARHRHLDFRELMEITSALVARTIERVDPYTAGHGERTRRYCDCLAERLGVDRSTRERLQLAAISHDYGKIFLRDLGFLTKAGPLSTDEYREVQRHPSLGSRKLGSHPRLRDVCLWIEEHHERWDGRGYPHGKRGEAISLPGRILGIVEVFDSLATRRSYKEAWDLQRVLDLFESESGNAFDPEVTATFLALFESEGEDWLRRPAHDRHQRAASGLA